MREIKFRGKRKSDGKWIYGFYLINPKGPCIYDPEIGDMPIIPETVGQFTGQMDSKRTEEYPKGQEICQGDMVEASIYCDEEPQELEVIFRRGAFVIDYEDSESDCVIVGEFAGSLKIIGNIHEPRTIKGE